MYVDIIAGVPSHGNISELNQGQPMNILITGTDGFIGSHLKDYFIKAGHDVTATVFNEAPRGDDYCIDIRSPDSIASLPGLPYDAVINAAGIVDQKAPSSLMMQVNAEGARNLAAWAARNKCRHFIQLSSIAVYGLRTLGTNRSEEATPRFRGILGIPYMRSKARAEKFIEHSGAPYTLLRMPAVIGRGDSFTSPGIVRRLESGKFFFCGRGEKPVSLLFAKNLGPCIDLIIGKGPFNRAFNCADHHVPWRELVAHYAAILGRPLPAKKKGLYALPFYWSDAGAHMLFTFSCFGSHFPADRLFEATGFIPPYDWKEGVRESVEDIMRR